MEASERETATQAATAERDEPLVRAAVGTGADRSHWWLRTAWVRHRNTIQDVHPLLVALQDGRGTGFMIAEHVAAMLDARKPDDLVHGWLQAAPPAGGPQGNPETLPAVPDA